MKTAKHFTKIISLLIFSLTFFVVVPCHGGLRPVDVDVVMADGELFFVLEAPKEIESVYVALHLDPLEALAEAKKKENKRQLTMWAVEYVPRPGEKKKKYPELEQIKYAGKISGLETTEGPFELQKNVKYRVRIEIYGREFASEVFYITDDNKAILLTRKQKRVYSVSVDKDGNKKLILDPDSK